MNHCEILVAHPSPDLYGSDLQMLVTVQALMQEGWGVTVVIPVDGPLSSRLRACGAQVLVSAMPVLRKSVLTPRGLVGFLAQSLSGTWRSVRMVRSRRPDVVLVNTVTIPTWLLGARLARTPVLSHVHEAEEEQGRVVRSLLAGQLLLADRIVVNSAAARRALVQVVPWLERRLRVVHNGVPGPPAPLSDLRQRTPDEPLRAVLVARLSPRKGVDVALEAVAQLRREGQDVSLDICGTVFDGYEWYEEELRRRAAMPDLAGAVTFHGYVSPTWPALERADVVLVPSRVEPFGNTAVEAMLAGRPLVASGVQGLLEVVTDLSTGLHVRPGDSQSLADALLRIAREPSMARGLARAAQGEARRRFSPETYSELMVGSVRQLMA
ncbi:glycosyltransferase family 4 protein [Serinicoccus hydrothermalis]|uniref:glycosyltransferase family 4 protein n=1 Tax=Serinicoccus hydrothermalis TaxID=1758689 RepID=UPI00082C6569|nr:glycosyltransferase family 4 protein [Serinicoccus hydrothermalis]